MGPLALMAHSAGFSVFGSDLAEGAVSGELFRAGIKFKVGAQDGSYLREVASSEGVDWFVYTSALPDDHPEIRVASELGIRISKRDELIAYLIDKLDLKLVAVAGTHGKTTTTAMIIWACVKLGIPISYLVGTTLPFAEAGRYDPSSEFLVYEADEYDRNFLHFSPWLSVITAVSYDHPDVYPSRADYALAFRKFEGQSESVISEPGETDCFTLPGAARRYDAGLAFNAVVEMAEEIGKDINADELISILDRFPGVGRRFEEIVPGVYSDYGHHPEEIAATLELAREEASRRGFTGVVAVYEPHQNSRQHEVINGYREAFAGVSRLYWLPTFLTREDPELAVISPAEFVASLANASVASPAVLDEDFADELRKWRSEGYLVLLLSAGPADGWLRGVFK